MRTLSHYQKLLADNPNASFGFTLAADMVYAAMHGTINRSEAHGGEEWRNIARRLKSKYGENLSADEIRREMETYPAAAALGRKGGSAKSEAKTRTSRANARLGGRPRSESLTPNQQQAYDLRLQGLALKDIAQAMGRQPETIRQLLGRVSTKMNIPGGWAGITARKG